MNRYLVKLDFVENDKIEIPNSLKSFELEEIGITHAAEIVDEILFKNGIVFKPNEFVESYNDDETKCDLEFLDSNSHLTIKYIITKQFQ